MQKTARIELDGIIVVSRLNLSIAAECMASSVNNCIQLPFVAGCRMRMSCCDGNWHDFDWVDAMKSLPEVNNAMSFLTRNNFIVGPNNPPGPVATWIFWNIAISVDGEIINKENTLRKGNNAVIGILPADQENKNIFNSTTGEMIDFITMNSPWCLIYVTATNANGNQEPHILSFRWRDKMGHYYLLGSAAWEVLMFRFQNLAHLANNQ